jgi:SAM-dependent methyltransferase
MRSGGRIGYRLLRWIHPGDPPSESERAPSGGRLEGIFGGGLREAVRDRTVIDWGCGAGREVVELAKMGATHVIGLDVRDEQLDLGRRRAEAEGVSEFCSFTTSSDVKADAIVSIDAFEHFADPAGVLVAMADRLAPGARVWVSFGPPWLHPRGGHLFSVFPWAHLVFSEGALLRWRSDIRSDGATRFHEVEGGLNQMTVRRFREYVESSPLEIEAFEAIPIRMVRPLHNRWTQEFFTSVVRCRLHLRDEVDGE